MFCGLLYTCNWNLFHWIQVSDMYSCWCNKRGSFRGIILSSGTLFPYFHWLEWAGTWPVNQHKCDDPKYTSTLVGILPCVSAQGVRCPWLLFLGVILGLACQINLYTFYGRYILEAAIYAHLMSYISCGCDGFEGIPFSLTPQILADMRDSAGISHSRKRERRRGQEWLQDANSRMRVRESGKILARHPYMGEWLIRIWWNKYLGVK